MKFALIICTYMRPKALLQLLQSVAEQTVAPTEIIIVDGSLNDHTQQALQQNELKQLRYFMVSAQDRGLTKQRNYGIARVSAGIEVVCFLDDDVVLKNDYFGAILEAFNSNSTIVGVGGVAINENKWSLINHNRKYNKYKFYEYDGYVYPEASRQVLRNRLGLASDVGPSKMPLFSHGRSCGFPLTGKVYEVDLLIGMAMSFRIDVVQNIKFSTYFEGYGLYEDADFSLRAQQFGKNVMASNAQLFHYHDAAGRPNQYHYGKMVVRNGWYVWRVKNPNPTFLHRYKWNALTLLLTLIRYMNVLTTSKRKEALTEAIGRTVGWWSLLINKPK